MAADMHIHIFDGITEEDLKGFFCWNFGSKYFDLSRARPEDISRKMWRTPSVWVGEVSWLKAGLMLEGEKEFVPAPVGKICELIGEDLPVLDDILIKNVLEAMDLPNTTGYELNTKENVREFLLQHKGKRVFTVSW